MKRIKKLLNIIKNILLRFLDPLSGDQKIYNSLTKVEKIARIISLPIVILLTIVIIYIFQTQGYKEFLIATVLAIIIFRTITQLEIYSIIKREKAWAWNFANTFFDILIVILILDFIYQAGLYSKLQLMYENRHEYGYFNIILYGALGFIFYAILFFITGRIRRSLFYLMPDFRKFFRNKKLANQLLNFIFLTFYIAFFFAVLHYLVFLIFGAQSYTGDKVTFQDLVVFSFSILYSAPISSVLPKFVMPKIITGLEALISYLLLVVFIAYLLNNYIQLKRPQAIGRKKYLRKNN